MIARRFCGVCIGLLLLAAGCEGELRPDAEYATPPGSIAPELNAGADGRIYLSWLQQSAQEQRLRYAILDERGWSGPHTAVAGSGWPTGQSDWPGVTAIGRDALAAHWQLRRGSSGYAADIRMAFSADRGASWQAALPLHDDDTDTEHGFVAMLPLGDRLHVLWLDGRDTAAGHDHEHAGATALRHAIFDLHGRRQAETVVDARTCDCCHLSTAPIADGFILVYRDRTEADIRDIVARRFVNGAWQEPVTVHDDGWKIEGCPVNGPAVAVRGAQVTVAWFTGKDDVPAVHAAVSTDGGASFGAPLRIDEGRALGRVDLAASADGTAVISWAELDEDAAVFKLRRIAPGPDAGTGRVQRLPARAPSGFPRLVALGDDIVAAWTEGEGSGARVRAMRFDAGQF